MRKAANIFWLGIKELRSFLHDFVLLGLVIYAFSLAVIAQAQSYSQELHNASIGIVDEDHSELSRRIAHAFLPPYFQVPQPIVERDIVPLMNSGRYTFVVDIPPNFQRDVLGGRQPVIQINVDATAMVQAGLGSGYAQQIITTEITDFLSRSEGVPLSPVNLDVRIAFNPNVTTAWFTSVMAIINNVTMLAIILAGAAIIREREHGTMDHLLVMPLDAVRDRDVQGLGERLGDHDSGRLFPLHRGAHGAWDSYRRLDPALHGRRGDLPILCDRHRHLSRHCGTVHAATRAALHVDLYAHEHALRQQYATREHAVPRPLGSVLAAQTNPGPPPSGRPAIPPWLS